MFVTFAINRFIYAWLHTIWVRHKQLHHFCAFLDDFMAFTFNGGNHSLCDKMQKVTKFQKMKWKRLSDFIFEVKLQLSSNWLAASFMRNKNHMD